jgi:hypothetical protein
MRNYRSGVSVCIGGQGFTMPPKDIAALAHGPPAGVSLPGLLLLDGLAAMLAPRPTGRSSRLLRDTDVEQPIAKKTR